MAMTSVQRSLKAQDMYVYIPKVPLPLSIVAQGRLTEKLYLIRRMPAWCCNAKSLQSPALAMPDV